MKVLREVPRSLSGPLERAARLSIPRSALEGRPRPAQAAEHDEGVLWHVFPDEGGARLGLTVQPLGERLQSELFFEALRRTV